MFVDFCFRSPQYQAGGTYDLEKVKRVNVGFESFKLFFNLN